MNAIKVYFPVKKKDRWETLRSIFLKDMDFGIVTERMDMTKKGALCLLLPGLALILASLAFISPTGGGLGSNEGVDYTKVYYQEVQKSYLPEEIAQLKSGNICALYSYMGSANVYDESGKYKYTYRVPRGDEDGSCSLAIDGKYVIIINNRDDMTYIYKDDIFIETISLEETKKYEMQYADEYIDDDENLCKIVRPEIEEDDSRLGGIIVFLGILLTVIGASYIKRTDPKYLNIKIGELKE